MKEGLPIFNNTESSPNQLDHDIGKKSEGNLEQKEESDHIN